MGRVSSRGGGGRQQWGRWDKDELFPQSPRPEHGSQQVVQSHLKHALGKQNFSQGSRPVPCSATLLQQMWTNIETRSHTFMQRVKGP